MRMQLDEQEYCFVNQDKNVSALALAACDNDEPVEAKSHKKMFKRKDFSYMICRVKCRTKKFAESKMFPKTRSNLGEEQGENT